MLSKHGSPVSQMSVRSGSLIARGTMASLAGKAVDTGRTMDLMTNQNPRPIDDRSFELEKLLSWKKGGLS